MLIQRNHSLATRRTWTSTSIQTVSMFLVVGFVGLLIEVPTAIAQDDRETVLQKKIQDLQADRAKLQDQNSKYQTELDQLQTTVADLQNQIQEMADRMTEGEVSRAAEPEFGKKTELMRKIAALRVEHPDINDQLLHQKPWQLASDWLKKNDTSRNTVREDKSAANDSKTLVDESAVSRSERSRQNISSVLAMPSRSQIDLIQLASSYADALAARDIAAAETKHLNEAVRTGLAQRHEYEVAKIKLDAAARKVQVFVKVAQLSIQNLELELERAESRQKTTDQLVQRGYVSEAEAGRNRGEILGIRSNIEILQEIIGN